ncbi:hypothetical protein H072_3733 [Dactylellina haptotyla CBS 200.50]|uniref:Uncharacterized protein n=1 Tax=Dactylellina haptotyla (strain CBS 200.50) TaxID=1284197 RepID=S8BS41_DACHA|nr:hypothetical protein H072_3733 [Dactylellina haptotyla CBS 200.50]
MAFLGSPPQSYWPSQFVADPAFVDPELTDPAAGLHDTQQSALPHGLQPAENAHHILDPALSDEMPQGQHPIIFHQTSPHSYAPPPPFAQDLPPPPPPDQLYSPGRIRPPSAKEMQTHNNGEVVMDDGHGAAYIAPAQHPFLGNGMHHPDMHQPLGQPPQIKFRATTNTNSAAGGHGRRPKMTKEEQMARRRLRTDTDEYRTQERERMRRRRAREKEERERVKQEQEDQLRAEGKESWIAPAATTTPKRKTVKMVKKKAPAASMADDGTTEEDASRDQKRQAKVDNRAATHDSADGLDPMDEMSDDFREDDMDEEDEDLRDDIDDKLEELHDGTEPLEDQVDEIVEGEEGVEDGESEKKEEGGATRSSTRRAALGKTTPSTPASARPTRAATKASPTKSTPVSARTSRGNRSAAEPERVVQEVTTTRSGRTTRSALSTPKTAEKKESPAPSSQATTPAAPAPLKITTRKQTVTTPASPSSPAISKTRVSLKSLSTGASTPTPMSSGADPKSPTSFRPTDPKSGAMPPVVMLFGYPAGANPPCEVSSVSVTVESTTTSKICMMTAEDMRRPATPAADEAEGAEKMEIDETKEGEKKEEEKPEEQTAEEKEKEAAAAATATVDVEGAPTQGKKSTDSPSAQRKSSTPDSNANGRFSWDLVVQMLKADIGFDPAKDELIGFHHKDPLPLSCDRHINTAMVMAAKEGVRMPKWYVYEKQAQPQV